MKFVWIMLALMLVLTGSIYLVKYAGFVYNLPPSSSITPTVAPQSSGVPPINTTGLPLSIPDGFSITTFATDLNGPRVLIHDPQGVILASIPSQGRVVALPDSDHDGVADKTVDVVTDLNQPHGLAFRCSTPGACVLYVAEHDQIVTFNYNQTNFTATDKKSIVDLPTCTVQVSCHTTRTLLFLPPPHDDQFLISIGSSCNVCTDEDRRAQIMIANADGSGLRTYASGLRNSVFMTEEPVTHAIWATEMGRDLLGDDIPPDEVNIITDGKFYGWPFCYGQNVQDEKFDTSANAKKRCTDATPAMIDLQAHSAPLGLAFIPQEGWPTDLAGSLLVAYHGSWNRSVPTGYKIVIFGDQGRGAQRDFVTGFLTNDGTVTGRPVGILPEPNGVLHISDDKTGAIYRLQYKK